MANNPYAEFGFVPAQANSNDAYTEFGFVPDKAQSEKTKEVEPTFLDSLKEAGKNFANATIDAAEASKAGLRQFGAGINQFVYPAVDKIAGTDLANRDREYQQAKDAEFNQRYGGQLGPEIIKTATNLAPTFITGVAGAVSRAPMFASKLAQYGGLIGKNAALGGIMGATAYDPNYTQTIPQKAALGAAVGGAAGATIPAVLTGAEKLANAARLVKAFPGKIKSSKEMAQAIAEQKGLDTPIGDLIGSPFLKKFEENVVGSIPGSGVYANQMRRSEKLRNEAEEILNTLKPKQESENFGEDIVNHLVNRKKEVQAIKNQNYEAANELADQLGAKVNPLNYTSQAAKERALLDSYFVDEGTRKELSTILDKAQAFDNPSLNQVLGAAPKGESFKNTYLTKGLLNKGSQESLKNNDLLKAGVYDRLRNALKADVGDSVKNSNLPELKQKFNDAEKYYVEEYAPFKDKDILKFTNRGMEPEKIENHFITTGKDDRAAHLHKLMKLLPEDMNKTLAYRYLSQAKGKNKFGNDELDPLHMSKLYNEKLGDRTRSRLFPYVDFQKKMDNLSKRLEKNEGAFNAMYNPMTGARLTNLMGMAGGLTNVLQLPKFVEKSLTGDFVKNRYLGSLKRQEKGMRAIPDSIRDIITTIPLATFDSVAQ